MRVLGSRTSLSTFRWDLIYLASELAADDRPQVSALAGPVNTAIAQLGVERAALESAEDGVILSLAKLHRSDRRRDLVLLALGGVARATDKVVYGTLFGKHNPTATAKLGVDAESLEVKRILGELGVLDAANPLRSDYEGPLADAEKRLVDAKKVNIEARTELALARSRVERFKFSLDGLRLTTHGELLALLGDKSEVEAFFRPATVTADDDDKTTPAPPTPAQPAPGGSGSPGGSSLSPVTPVPPSLSPVTPVSPVSPSLTPVSPASPSSGAGV